MPDVKKIHHIALVVENIDEALGFWRDSLGIALDHIDQVPREKSAVAFLPVGEAEVELVQPTSDESGVAKYLAKRGPGMHHVCLEVEEIEDVLSGLVDKGIQLIHDVPVESEDGRKYAFIHPKAAYGVLVELYELAGEPRPDFPVLGTERLVLREFRHLDAPAVFEMYAREDMVRWLEHEPMEALAEAEERVRSRMSLFKKGWGCRWALAFKHNPDVVIGSCGFFSVRVSTHTMEMGFDLHPDYWRQGLMSEALTAMLAYCFSDDSFMHIHRLEALVDPGNEASIGLLTGLGFSDEGLRRDFGYWKGAYRDVKLFALLESEWLK